MENYAWCFIIVFVLLLVLIFVGRREKLSLSQFPSCIRPSPFLDANVATFDSSSTFQRYYTSTPPFPPITGDENIIGNSVISLVSEGDVKQLLDNGGILVVSATEHLIASALNIIEAETKVAGRNGYPDFYNIPGPIIVMRKVGENYHWMIGYPISYSPSNVSKFINMNSNWNVAKKAYHVGLRNMDPNAPVLFLR